MDCNRRTLLAAGFALAAEAAVTTDDSPARTPRQHLQKAASMRRFGPPPERLSLWPGAPPGAPETLPAPSLTMNGPRAERLLHVTGIAHPEINVFRAPRPDGSALLMCPGGAYR